MDLTLRLRELTLAGPVGVASGTFGYAKEYEALVDFSRIGAVYTKAVTPEPRLGNPSPRLVETASGMLNSIGLANVGVEAFIRDKMPFLRSLPSAVIVNVAGAVNEDYEAVLEALEGVEGVGGYEINVSCPNVKHGGMALGTDPRLVADLTRSLRSRTKRPLILKLSPNVTDIGATAEAAEAEGADAVSCINTLVGMVIDIRARKPVLPLGTGGLSGPAILPIAVAAVYKVSRRIKIPVIGIGGITRWQDAVQHLLAGAKGVQVGSGTFANPRLAEEVHDGIVAWCREAGVLKLADVAGLLG
ncbi:MAG: dihydroorotate dehydrogenase [Spirochaetales bacterium]